MRQNPEKLGKTDKRENSGHFPILSYFQKKIRMKNILSSQKSRKINPRLVKIGIRPAGSQKLTIRSLGKDMNRETKKFLETRVQRQYFSENLSKRVI